MASPPQDLPPDLFGGGGYIVRKIGDQIPYVFGASPVCPPSLSTCGFPASMMVDVDGNFSQVEFALSSWRETFLKVEIACSILVRIYGGKKSCTVSECDVN